MDKASKVVVINPFNAFVQKAVAELGPLFKDVDVIKLELSCPGNRLAWVSNKDYLENKPGKEKVIHLCLKKITDRFKEKFEKTSPDNKKDLKEVIKEFLVDVILPHETEHIDQIVEHKGEFGPASEQKAEKKEDWKKMEDFGIVRKCAHALDGVSNRLEAQGYLKLAYDVDIIANTLEKEASADWYYQNILEYIKKGNRNIPYLLNKIKNGFSLFNINPSKQKNLLIEFFTKTAIKPLEWALGLMLNPEQLVKETGIKLLDWARLSNMNVYDFKRSIENNLAPNMQSPASNNA